MTLLRRVFRVGGLAALALIAQANTAVAPSRATASPSLATGSLEFRATIGVTSTAVTCPPEAASDSNECRDRRGTSPVPGLGAVSENYVWAFGPGSPPCASNLVKPLAVTGRLVVAGKGELHVSLAEGACVDVEPVRNEPQNFTITGGTGSYQGASGNGTVTRSVSGGSGSETWTGTLVAPGVEFDLTAPAFSGAVSKTVRAPKRAKRVRVTYKVTANDDADGQVPAACTPRSGSRFPIGRTLVKCSATDSSANTAKASFRITVKRTR